MIQGLLKHSYIWRYIRLLTRAGMLVLLPLLFNLMTLLTCSTVPVSLNIYYHPIIITCGHSDHSLASVRQQTLSSHPLTLLFLPAVATLPKKQYLTFLFSLPLSCYTPTHHTRRTNKRNVLVQLLGGQPRQQGQV